jgi:MFS family permease
LIGGALQAATQNLESILVARVITGIGTDALTGITPVLISEVSASDHRDGFLGYVFIANYLGISVTYWLSFGLAFINDGYSDVRWRFLLAFQCFPALLLLAGIKMLPDSPRFYAAVGQFEKAKEVLIQIRGGFTPAVEDEYLEICALTVDSKPASPLQFAKVLIGRDEGKAAHLGKRAWLCLWLQIMASWSGVTAVTVHSPVLLSHAGYSTIKQNGLAGGLKAIGIVGTIISAQIVDRLGRRVCLVGGSAGLFAVNLIAAALYESTINDPTKAASIAPADVTMLFLFNLTYAATWGTVALVIPAEIFPSEMRVQGNGFGITG